MYQLTIDDYKKIKLYKKIKNSEIALYFFEKFRSDLVNIIFSKINLKFGITPLEKGDIVHSVWDSLIKTLNVYKNGQNFCANLITNCYQITIKEVRKFFNNSELVMNHPISLESYLTNNKNLNVCYIEKPKEIVVDEIINLACENIKEFTQPTIKRVIYLKSMGYSVKDICSKLRKNRYLIKNILNKVEEIVKKFY